MQPRQQDNHGTDRIAARRLRGWAPLLRLDQVRAGDVLLTRGRSFEAAVIAGLSGGPWSHAALWVPADPEYRLGNVQHWLALQLIESDDLGVGDTPLHAYRLSFGTGREADVARLPGAPKAAVLLRHPALAAVSETELGRAVRAMHEADLWRRYPPLDRLVGAAALPPALKHAVRQAFAVAYRSAADAPRPGPFCSQLVANFFATLGVPLFASGNVRPPSDVSPNDLAGPASLLSFVPEAIITAEELDADATAQSDGEDLMFSRAAMLPRIVRNKEEGERVADVVARISGRLRVQNAELFRQSRQIAAERVAGAWNNLVTPKPFNADHHRTAHTLYTSAVLARAYIDVLAIVADMPDAPRNRAWTQAILLLIEIQGSMISQITHHLHRTMLLATLRTARVMRKDVSREDRRRLLDDWWRVKRSRASGGASAPDQTESSHSPGIQEGDECQAYLQACIAAATRAAAAEIAETTAKLDVSMSVEGGPSTATNPSF
jgi:hypothetical protein